MDLQTYHLTLFAENETTYQLRLLDAQNQLCAQHAIDKTDLNDLLAQSQSTYQKAASDLPEQGQTLWSLVNGPTHTLQQWRQQGQTLQLKIQADAELSALPWELLNDGTDFICLQSTAFLPCRQILPRVTAFEPAARPLRILFMACAPQNVQPALNFEQEEARILERTEKHPIFLHVEESGSLEGLQEQIETYASDYFDICHLTGHADIDEKTQQPVFLMEQVTGEVDNVRPEQLASVFLDCGRIPRVLFLSGCRTGESRSKINAFSEQMVKLGMPVVLGWALPVNDVAATEAAGYFYEKLSTGVPIAQALVYARRKLFAFEQDMAKNSGSRPDNWHLLRLYSDATPLQALVTAPRQWTQRVLLEAQRRFLDPKGQQTEVCDRRGFIGRRRLLQRCLRALNLPASDPDAIQAVVLTGMGGLGKSSTAARLADRLQASHTLLVWRGRVDEIRVRETLQSYFAQVDPKAAFQQQLTDIFETHDLLLILDDFEQNRISPDTLQFTPQSLALLHQILAAIRDSASQTRVIITSRYHVPIEGFQLCSDEPNRLRDTDLDKKCQSLSQLRVNSPLDDTLRKKAIELADGIPRLLEWMNKALEPTQTPQALLDKLAQTQADYREQIVIDSLLDMQNRHSREILAYTALFHLPQPYAVIQPLLPDAHPGEAAFKACHQAGLLEVIHSDPPQYYVSTLLYDTLMLELTQEQHKNGLTQAADSLFQHQPEMSEITDREILRLALLAEHKSLAVTVGDRLSAHLLYHNRWPEALALCHDVLTLQEDFRLWTGVARAEHNLGLVDSSDHFKQAIACFPADPDDALLYEQSVTLHNYANLLMQQGETDQAQRLLQEQVMPILKRLEKHREAAVTMGQIADILQARGQLDEALAIRREQELPVYEQLGDVREKAIAMGKIADILQARGQLDEALVIRQEQQLPVYEQLGDVRSKAVTMGQIADILQARGQLDEALEIRQEQQLPVFEQLGDVRSLLVARTNTALLLWKIHGQARQAEVKALLCESLQAAKRLRIPEAETIERWLQQLKLSC